MIHRFLCWMFNVCPKCERNLVTAYLGVGEVYWKCITPKCVKEAQ